MIPLTAQQIFDTGLQVMRERGYHPAVLTARSGDKHGSCKYRGGPSEAPMCLIGLVIPDELYDGSFEGETIRTILSEAEEFNENHRLRQLFSGVERKFLGDWQAAHDALNGKPPHEWPSMFERAAEQVAYDWHLTYKPPVKALSEA